MQPFLLDPYDDHAGADYTRIKAVSELFDPNLVSLAAAQRPAAGGR